MKTDFQQPEYSLPEPELAIAVSGGYMLCEFREDLPRETMRELISFVNLFEVNFLTRRYKRRHYEELKHSWVTKDFQTIWQLSHEQAKKERSIETIGWDDMASPDFFRWLLSGLIKANPHFKPMLASLSRRLDA